MKIRAGTPGPELEPAPDRPAPAAGGRGDQAVPSPRGPLAPGHPVRKGGNGDASSHLEPKCKLKGCSVAAKGIVPTSYAVPSAPLYTEKYYKRPDIHHEVRYDCEPVPVLLSHAPGPGRDRRAA